jgi:hypothetical protein
MQGGAEELQGRQSLGRFGGRGGTRLARGPALLHRAAGQAVRDATRRSLMASVRVGLLIIEDLRAAPKEGRPCAGRAEMRKAAEWAAKELRDLVWNYHDRQRRRAGYR